MAGRLRCIQPLRFVDGVLAVGEEVDQVEPTVAEQKGGQFFGGLESDMRGDPDQTPPKLWVVVVWRDKRRRVPIRAFRRMRS